MFLNYNLLCRKYLLPNISYSDDYIEHAAILNLKLILHYLFFSVDSGVQVRYGKTKSLEMTQTKFTFRTYKASDMCESNANTTGFWDPGFIYDVLLTDLKPNTRYYYSCGSKEVYPWIFMFDFKRKKFLQKQFLQKQISQI